MYIRSDIHKEYGATYSVHTEIAIHTRYIYGAYIRSDVLRDIHTGNTYIEQHTHKDTHTKDITRGIKMTQCTHGNIHTATYIERAYGDIYTE